VFTLKKHDEKKIETSTHLSTTNPEISFSPLSNSLLDIPLTTFVVSSLLFDIRRTALSIMNLAK
jgi:hypothetical protein